MNEVQDRQAENGIKLQNILTFLVLAVMTWVGTNIEIIKKDMAANQLETRLNSAGIIALSKRVDNNEKNIDKLRERLK